MAPRDCAAVNMSRTNRVAYCEIAERCCMEEAYAYSLCANGLLTYMAARAAVQNTATLRLAADFPVALAQSIDE